MAYAESSPSVASEMIELGSVGLLEEVRQGMQNMWRTKKYSDFIINARGEEIKTHKFVLASHMKFFDESSMRLEQGGKHMDQDAETMRTVLTFLYEGKVEVPREKLQTVSDAAQLLGVETLKKICAYRLLEDAKVTADNCLAVWEAALDVKQEARATQALQVALQNFRSVQRTLCFLNLCPELLAEYLGHSELKVSCPDEQLGAATDWLMHAPDKNGPQMASVLQALPLHRMQEWHLQKTLDLPAVKASTQASAYIQDALAGTIPVGVSTTSQHLLSLPEACFIYGGGPATLWNHSNLSVAWLQRNMEEGLLLRNAGDFAGAALCCDNNSVYIGILEGCSRDLWKFDFRSKTKTKVGSLAVSRKGHAMCVLNGLVYVFGGRDIVGREKVEVFNPTDGSSSSRVVGSLAFSHLPHGSHRLVCCPVPRSKQILVYGASYRDAGGVYPTFHTLQLYDTDRNETKHWIRLPASTGKSAYSVLIVDEANLILVAEDYTAICSMKTLLAGGIDKGTVCKRFTVPNIRCAAVLSHDKECVILLGGKPKPEQAAHFVYGAYVKDINSNHPVGWEKLDASWPRSETLIDSYTSANLDYAIIHE